MPNANAYRRSRRDIQRVRDMLSVGKMTGAEIAKAISLPESSYRKHFGDIIAEFDIPAGKKPFEPSDAQRQAVRLMAAIGVSQESIASHLDLSMRLLTEYFSDELKRGKTQADMQVAGNLFKMATGSPSEKTTVTAAIWWTKARMGWKDTSRIEQTGADGAAIKHEMQVQIFLPDNGRGDGPTPIAPPNALEIEHQDDAVLPDEVEEAEIPEG